MGKRNRMTKAERIAGRAVDLDQLRKPDDDQIKQQTASLLKQAGLLCPCGARVGDEGVELFSVVLTPVRTPRGPEQQLVGVLSTYHAPDCPAFLEQLTAGPDAGAQALAVRAALPVRWLDDQPVGINEDEDRPGGDST